MADLIEYVRWRGDLSFRERPFNDVDNLVFCQIVYHSFDGIVPEPKRRKKIRLRDAAARNLEHPDVTEFPGLDQDRNNEFLRAAAGSERFGAVKMSDYVNIVYNEPDGRRMQFCALVYHLPDGSRYLAFRGTDNTVVGWREDFMISYTDTEAQHRALVYTENVLRKYAARPGPWRIGGHSKGGNLAEYTFLRLSPALQERICGIYSNDGPGFAPEVFGDAGRENGQRMMSRYHKFITTYDVVGLLFTDKELRDNPERYPWLTIVASSAKGLTQHWMLTWQVLPDGFETRDRLENGSQVISDMLDQWVTSSTLEDREAFISSLFDALDRRGSDIGAVLSKGKIAMAGVLREIMKDKGRAKHMCHKLLGSLGARVSSQLGHKVLSAGGSVAGVVLKPVRHLRKLSRGPDRTRRSLRQAQAHPRKDLHGADAPAPA